MKILIALAVTPFLASAAFVQEGNPNFDVLSQVPCPADIDAFTWDPLVTVDVIFEVPGVALDTCAWPFKDCGGIVRINNNRPAGGGGVLGYSWGGTAAIPPTTPVTPVVPGASEIMRVSKGCGADAGQGVGEGITLVCGGVIGAVELRCPCDH